MASEELARKRLKSGTEIGQNQTDTIPTAEVSRIERVFPIRIQVPQRQLRASGRSSATATSTAQLATVGSEGVTSQASSTFTIQGDTQPGIDPPKVYTTQLLNTIEGQEKRYVTNRFSYLSRDGEDTSIAQKVYRCEDEPIHIPGAIQQFGALVATREGGDGRFLVRVVSENSQAVTGLEPDALFELRCFTDVLTERDKKEFLTRVQALHESSRTDPDVFTLSLTSLEEAPRYLFCAMHLNEESDLIICEFELKQDIFNPIHPPEDGLPDEPVRIIEHKATEAERQLSTMSKSRPLHTVRVARQSGRRVGSMELFHVLCEIQTQLATATTLQSLLDIAVGLVYELTSFHRVMVYQFDETGAGSVVSEIVDVRASTDIYRGLHFPASDIPQQARQLYMINKVRVLYDREQETARLVCRTFDDATTPLDLKHSYLRAMSPIHIKYLENMGVWASMSISLMVDNNLWGLISCHSYGSGMRVSLPVRELCRGLGQAASINIEKLLYSARIKARKPISKAPKKASPTAFIAASSSDLLNMFGADFGFLAIKGEARTIGRLFAYNEAIALLQYIRQRAFTEIFSSQAIWKDCPDILYAPGSSIISGMLVIPLIPSGTDFLVFFRKGKTKEIHWAGNPYEMKVRRGTASYLEPRSSFKRWSEDVVGISRVWTEDEVESAAVLSTLYGRFIEVWRQKEAIVQRNRMTRLLIRNAGHEARTPLNSIINYLEVALEETLDERARQHLQKSLQASKSLVFVVNDLLNLTEAEDADFDIHEDNVDLKSLILEVITAFKDESIRKNLEIRLSKDEAVPATVRCDPAGLRQVISNLLDNAIKHSSDGLIKVGLDHLSDTEANSLVEISFEDAGVGLSEMELDRIFQDFEQILDEDEDQASAHEDKEQLQTRQMTIGLGLAFTARFVRLNRGQISISSEEGRGVRVSIKIPFRKAFQGDLRKKRTSTEISLPTPPRDMLTPDSTEHLSKSISTYFSTSERSSPKDLTTTEYLSGSREKDHATGRLIPGSMSTTSLPLNTTSADPSGPESAIGGSPFPVVGSAQHKLRVLLAEDNPLNSRLLEARLAKRGYEVKVAVNGQACADAFKTSPEFFDIILMDLQMPLVDGVASTRLIRAFEKESCPPISQRVKSYGRIPIIAVSASLLEQSRDSYIDNGFDGWILKPIDFKRLESILAAVQDEQIRAHLLYSNESWKKGGWFNLNANKSN